MLPASLMLQMLSIFFTGGFRRPRQGSWVLLALTFVLALAGGWSGYGLPDDMLAGTGPRIAQGILLGIPVIGTHASFLLLGGEFPGHVIERMYWLHVAVVPALVVPAWCSGYGSPRADSPPSSPHPGGPRGTSSDCRSPRWPCARSASSSSRPVGS